MNLSLVWIGKTGSPHMQALTGEYAKRIGRYLSFEVRELRSESALLKMVANSRTRPAVILADVRGRQMTSEELAALLRRHQEAATPALIFGIGPADGWSAEFREGLVSRDGATELSLGKMTFAHEIARLVLLEQIYRAFTILARHPYHLGH